MSPFVIVIFGATGDLAQHKLLPALYSLYKNKLFGDPTSSNATSGTGRFYIVGFSRKELDDEAYRQMLGKELEQTHSSTWRDFAKNIYYQQGVFDSVDGYNELIEKLNGFDTEIGACITRLFYFSTAPDNYETILRYLESTKLSEGCGQGSEQWTRLAVEKPFGKDLETSQALDNRLCEIFEEKQIYRVDHYLGKETMRNMVAFRFANSIFEPVWNSQHIDHVQITWAEKEGVKTRGAFFDANGMLRDVGQNHLLQMLATVAMEQPSSFTREGIRDARANVLKAIRHITPPETDKYVVRGQYKGYREEAHVAPDSVTETFFAAKFFIDTPRFTDIPFYVRAGKKMKQEHMEINIVFKQMCHLLFKEFGCPEIGNVLTIRIQPDEGIKLRLNAKKPGNVLALETVDMNFSYHQTFGGHGADAYEKILLDILAGDQMLFNRSDELESSWHLISPILKGWHAADRRTGIPSYEQGSWGPDEAVSLIERDGRKWLY